MQLYYEGTNITDDVDVVKGIHRDVSGGRCDCLELVLENAAAWYRWQPKTDDVIRVTYGSYDTGELYLNTILPEAGKYRILATSTPSSARRKANGAYEAMKLSDIMTACAAECGMNSALYGVNGDILYPFLLRQDESAPAFLNRILGWEGATLKAYNGRLMGISIDAMQRMTAGQTIEITASQQGVRYLRRENAKISGVTIKTPFAEGRATDVAAVFANAETYTHYPALDSAQAGRWSRGLLLLKNRQAEELHISMEFNPGLTAMSRIDIDSATDAAGEWLIDEVTHDFVRKSSSAKLLRCIATVG